MRGRPLPAATPAGVSNSDEVIISTGPGGATGPGPALTVMPLLDLGVANIAQLYLETGRNGARLIDNVVL